MFVPLLVLAGFASSASAQGFGIVGGQGNAFGGGGGGFGVNQGFTGYNPGYSGFNTGVNQFGYYNGGFGAPYNNGFVRRATPYPQTQNTVFGLMNTIQTQTGKGNSYRQGYGPAVGGRRR